jgi:chromosome segregation ATPase
MSFFRSERELLNAEISQSRATVESLREEVRRLETDVTTNRSIVTQLQRQLTREKQSSSSLQEENLQQRQQVSVLQFELEKEKSEKRKLEETKSRYENDEATQSARVSPDPRHSASNYSENDENLRTRITALSQALLEKQSLVNNLSADKQLLQIKAERLQEEMRRMGNEISANSSGFSHTGKHYMLHNTHYCTKN